MSDIERFLQLQEELKRYEKLLAQSTDAVLDADVSKYPILLVHQQQVDVGIPLIEEPTELGMWKINISSLEEFVTKQIIEMDRVDNFIKVYKDPGAHFCLFVISELGAQFIFMPRQTD